MGGGGIWIFGVPAYDATIIFSSDRIRESGRLVAAAAASEPADDPRVPVRAPAAAAAAADASSAAPEAAGTGVPAAAAEAAPSPPPPPAKPSPGTGETEAARRGVSSSRWRSSKGYSSSGDVCAAAERMVLLRGVAVAAFASSAAEADAAVEHGGREEGVPAAQATAAAERAAVTTATPRHSTAAPFHRPPSAARCADSGPVSAVAAAAAAAPTPAASVRAEVCPPEEAALRGVKRGLVTHKAAWGAGCCWAETSGAIV